MKKRIIITIKANFGSEWQEETQVAALKLLMYAWTKSLESTHKKNNAEIDIAEPEYV